MAIWCAKWLTRSNSVHGSVIWCAKLGDSKGDRDINRKSNRKSDRKSNSMVAEAERQSRDIRRHNDNFLW